MSNVINRLLHGYDIIEAYQISPTRGFFLFFIFYFLFLTKAD